jgi:threonine dehydratase
MTAKRSAASASDERRRILEDYALRIEQAATRVYHVAQITPLCRAARLSARLGCELLLKREDLQPVYSFKLRGAYNKIAQLSEEQRARGVIAASAGNHAQGVALAGAKLGIAAWIVMPRTTPSIKVESVRAFGGRAILHGDSFDEAAAHACELADSRGMTMVHPYDDPDVIAGQGTIAKEIFEQHTGRPIDVMFVCVGGGGLLAGIAAWTRRLSPTTRIVAVEPDDSNCMGAAIAADERVALPQVGLFADGVAVRQAGEETFRIARALVDECITVTADEICAATRDVFYDHRALPEPAGALAVAGAKRWVLDHGAQGLTICAIVSGANVSFDRLRHIAERAELGDASEALLAVTIPEAPGSFRRFLRDLGKHGITEFNYRYAGSGAAHIFVGVKLAEGRAEAVKLVEDLRTKGYPVVDLSGDEIAKVHIRYMVGGRAPGLNDERLIRLEFPERPGALLNFLSRLGDRWNISLFHYRNHGAAYGRVLVGVQVPDARHPDFARALDAVGYPWWDESANPAYAMFVGTQDL